MEQPSRTLEEFKRITQIEDLENMSPEQFEKVQNLVAQEKLSEEQLAGVIPYIPNFLDLQKDSISKVQKNLEVITENAATSQQAALATVAASLDRQFQIIQQLAESATTDEMRLELANITKEVGQDARHVALAMNQDNNRFWHKHGKWVVAGGAIAGAGALFFLTRGRVNVVKPAMNMLEHTTNVEVMEIFIVDIVDSK